MWPALNEWHFRHLVGSGRSFLAYTFFPSIDRPKLIAWLALVFDLRVRVMYAVCWFEFCLAMGLMYFALVIELLARPLFLSISDKVAAERGSKEIGTFSTMRWYRRSLTITSGPKWSRKALRFAGDEIHAVDVVDSNS